MTSVSSGMQPIHPGAMLREELQERDLSADTLAGAVGIPPNRIRAILNGRTGITANTALRLARYLGTTPRLWLNLQKNFELRVAELRSGEQIAERVRPADEAEARRRYAPAGAPRIAANRNRST